MQYITEDFKTSKQNPGSIIWANGTTDKRYILAKRSDGSMIKPHFFMDPYTQNEDAVVDYLRPLYFTNNVPYIFEYIRHHITKDYEVDRSSSSHEKHVNAHGLVVFVKLKDGISLFDFSDPKDYEKAFEDSEDPLTFMEIFKGIEPYFAFNTAISNSLKDLEPIEFSIAKRIAVFLKSGVDHYNKDGSIKKSFFDKSNDQQSNSFFKLFRTAEDESIFDIKVTQDEYRKMLDFYNQTMELKGAKIEKSRHGRDQFATYSKQGKREVWKVYPDKLSDEQLKKVNCYMKLLKLCAQNKNSYISSNPAIMDILNNTDPKQRKGFSDLLQACLYASIAMAFDGFYCPEYIGGKVAGLKTTPQAICIFDRNSIQTIKAYTVNDVIFAMYMNSPSGDSTTNETLTALRDNMTQYMSKKRADMLQRRQLPQEIERRKKLGEFYVDKNFSHELYSQYLKQLNGNDPRSYVKKHLKQFIEDNTGKFVKSSPYSLIKKWKSEIHSIERRA